MIAGAEEATETTVEVEEETIAAVEMGGSTARATRMRVMIATTDDGTDRARVIETEGDQLGIEIPGATGPDPATDRLATGEHHEVEATVMITTPGAPGTMAAGADEETAHLDIGTVCTSLIVGSCVPNIATSIRRQPPQIRLPPTQRESRHRGAAYQEQGQHRAVQRACLDVDQSQRPGRRARPRAQQPGG